LTASPDCGLTKTEVIAHLRQHNVATIAELRYVLYETKGELPSSASTVTSRPTPTSSRPACATPPPVRLPPSGDRLMSTPSTTILVRPTAQPRRPRWIHPAPQLRRVGAEIRVMPLISVLAVSHGF
jgi:hypothetical protein